MASSMPGAAPPLPPRVAEALGDRLAALPPEDRALLSEAVYLSDYLADRLASEPALLDRIFPIGPLPDLAGYAAALAEAVPQPAGDPDGLRRFVHGENCRILLAERAEALGRPGAPDFPAVLKSLSDLAEAVVAHAAADIVRREEARYGPAGTSWVILALGKLGAQELNFSSDLDLVFFYGEEGEDGGYPRSERFQRRAEALVRLLSERRATGIAYRVDTRLRPEGAAGPLVRTLEGMLRHYERAGAAWERQALVRARPVAGDRDLAARFAKGIEPFVWRKTLDRDAVAEIEAIQSRILAEGGGYENIKRGPGGIREVEFFVQILQLANGGRNPSVRDHRTLGALAALERGRYLAPEERAEAEACYLHLRRVEHLLQARAFQQTHRLPKGDDLERIARAMGHPSGDAFLAAHGEVRRRVRALLEAAFRRGRRIAVSEIERSVLEALDEAAEPALRDAAVRRLGLSPASRPVLAAMARGTQGDPATSTVRRRFVRASDGLLPLVAAAPDPDGTLRRLARIFDRYGARGVLYETLADHREVADLLVRAVGRSAFLADRIEEDPGNLEAFLAPQRILARPDPAAWRARAAAYRAEGLDAERWIWDEARLHAGAALLLGRVAPAEAGALLSEAARIALAAAVPEGLGVVLFGGAARGETAFLSDCDVAFVSEGLSLEEATKAVEGLLNAPARARLPLDARLRPRGRSGPLVVTTAALADYLAREAEPWERVVWTETGYLRRDAPAAALPEPVAAARADFLARPLSDADRAALRKVLERAQREGGPDDPKKRAGGALALDFLLVFGAPAEEVRSLRRALFEWRIVYELLFGTRWTKDFTDEEKERIRSHFEEIGRTPPEPDEVAEEVRRRSREVGLSE